MSQSTNTNFYDWSDATKNLSKTCFTTPVDIWYWCIDFLNSDLPHSPRNSCWPFPTCQQILLPNELLCSSETFPCRNVTLHTYISNIASSIAHIHISFQRLKKTTSCSLIILNLRSAVLTLFRACEWASAFVLVFSGKPLCLCSKMKTPYSVRCKIDLVSNVLMSLTFTHCERAQLVTLQHVTVCFWIER